MPVGITTIGNEGKRSSATFTVAASDSLHKERADYVCVGVDDQKQIQAAIAALSDGGGKIVLLEGTYIVNGICVSDNITLQGQGFSTKVYLVDGCTGPVITNSDYVGGNIGIVIRDLFVDGNATNAVSYSRGIEFNNCAKSSILNCWAQNCKEGGSYDIRGVGIYVGNGSTDIIVKNCFATNNGHEGIGVRQLCERVFVIGCKAWDNYMEGIQVAINSSPGACKDILIMGNICNGNPSSSYPAIIGHGNGLERISFIGNIVYGTGAGIQLLTDENYNLDCVISDNLINVPYFGISITRAKRPLVSGNQIRSTGHHGIILDDSESCTVSNNKILGAAEEFGLFLNASDYFLCIGNNVRASNAGLVIYSSFGIIKGNYLYSNVGSGIFTNGSRNIIVDNYILDNNTADDDEKAGLWVTGTYNSLRGNYIYLSNPGVGHKDGIHLSPTAEYSLVEGNMLWQSGKTNIILNEGATGVVIRNNPGYLTKNMGISTGTGAQQTIAHGLAKTPTKVVLWNIEDGANPYQSAAADGTNIKITAIINQDWGWEAEVL